MTKGLVRANNLADLSSKQDSLVNLGLVIADYDSLKSLYATAGLDFSIIGGIAGSTGNYQAQVDGISSTLSGIVLSGFVNRQGNSSISTSWTNNDGIISISGVLSGYSPSSGTTFALSIEQGEAVITTSGLSANDLAYNSFRQANSTVVRANPPSGFNTLQLIPLQVGGQSFFVQASETPSFHIAPARMRHALDLVTGSVLGTYNSASPAWAMGPDGVLFQPTANAPVIEYDPTTGACLGARIWGVVTNQIRNNTNVGAVAGTPGTLPTNWTSATPSNGLSRQIVGVGTVNGVDYIDIRYFGTTTAASTTTVQFESQTAVTAASGETWTASTYAAIVGGSLSNIIAQCRLRVTGRNTTGTLQENQQTDNTVDSSFVRKSATATFANVNTTRVSFEFIFTYNSGVAIDVTYRLGLPQLEKSSTMGPVVKTSGLAASSTADVWSITGADFSRIWNQSAVTLYGEAERDVVPANEFATIMSANDGSNSNRVRIGYFNEAFAAGTVNYNNVAVAELYPSASGRRRRVALAATENDAACVFNGGNVATDASLTMPTVGQLNIGALPIAGGYLNGYIRELAIFRSRRPNANLQAMTS